MKNCVGISLLCTSACLSSELARPRQLNDMPLIFCRILRVRSWETHIQGLWVSDVTESFVHRRRRSRMSFGSARLMQLSVQFQSKWHDAPFCAFLSIFHESTSQCNERRPVKIRCRYINPKTKRCAVSCCIQVTNSQGHLTFGSKNSPMGRFLVLCAPVLLSAIIFRILSQAIELTYQSALNCSNLITPWHANARS